ncbi:uncharacterized protein LOC126759363 [Bactrocera neohumeralis]|uniref:uncharacterized protein LOC126759363 n=1 Tax=Bactrocera neohumeralis TaxID=98809 RepID=UPI0021664656|nr:uncharacterized protein LOC126759363 [Bactrocera neohumeralis]
MNCAYICYFSLCIGTALAVLYNGEAPKQQSETVVGALQQQQKRRDPLTLPGYHYSGPAATAQQEFTGYRYSAPAATAAETTTSTTTVRPPTTAAPTQPAAIGYIYNKPLAESYNRQALYLHAPHYQLSHQTSALALSSDADVGQQLPLGAAPTYYVPQAEVVNSGKHFEATQPNFFVPRIVTGAAEVAQTSTPAPQAPKAQSDEAAASTGYNYARPVGDAELTADTPASYQQAFQQFADYLIWQRAQSKQQEQTRIDTQMEAKQQQQTIPHAAQAYGDSTLQQFSFPSAHRQYEPATAPSSGLIQTRPQAAPVTFATQGYAPATAASATTVGAQQSINLLASAPASKPALVEKRPLNNDELLSGERFISKDNAVEYYMEMPSQSFELPTYSTMEMTPSQELSSNHDQSTSQSYAQSNAAKLAQQSSEQLYQNNVEQTNAPYFYEPAKQFAQTAQHHLQLQQQRHTPAQQAYVVQEQRPVAAAQQKESLAKAQQQSQQLASDKRFAQTFAQQPTEAQAPQSNAAWFAEIPQWPQNEALQVQQQQQPLQQQLIQQPQTLYSRVVKPLAQAQQHPHQLQQQRQSEKQNYYSKAQPELRPQSQAKPLTSAAAEPATTLEHSSQRLPQPTQAAQPSQANTATANSNAVFNFDSAHFRRPHSTYGVPLGNNKASGYNYQRPAGH